MPTNRVQNLSEINSKKKPRVETAWIPLDGEVAAEYNELEAKVHRLRTRTNAATQAAREHLAVELAQAEEELKVAEAALRKVSAPFKFKAIGRKTFDKLVDECQPTEAQIAEAEKINPGQKLRWNPDRLFVKLVPKSCYDPMVTEDEALEMLDDPKWNEAEISTLFMAALTAQQTVHQINLKNLGNGSRGTSGSVSN